MFFKKLHNAPEMDEESASQELIKGSTVAFNFLYERYNAKVYWFLGGGADINYKNFFARIGGGIGVNYNYGNQIFMPLVSVGYVHRFNAK